MEVIGEYGCMQAGTHTDKKKEKVQAGRSVDARNDERSQNRESQKFLNKRQATSDKRQAK